MEKAFCCLCIFVLLFLPGGCKSSRDKVKNKLENMKTKPVYIPYGKMLLWTKDSTQDKCPNRQTEFKLVVYIDSTHCTECALKGMFLWDDYYNLERKYEGFFRVIFIVQTSKRNSTEAIVSALSRYGVEYPMYIDSTCIFSSMNPHVPSEDMYHVFLTDNKNNVLLVGSPLLNSRIEKRILGILDKKINGS